MGQILRIACTLLLLALPLTAQAEQIESRNFQVLRNGTPIGHHIVTIRRNGERTDVNVDIRLRVTVAGVLTLYRYIHDSHEIWEGDRLVSLKSTTDNDGDAEYLNATAAAAGLQVDGSRFKGMLPADTMPTSYWRSDFVQRATIMDSQNGRRLDLVVKPSQLEMASVATSDLPAYRYDVTGEVDLTLWYGRDGRWVKTAFPAKDGSKIEYLLQ
ncbi:DUF6134 family protein [Ferrovibrio terrae]|uniref:DUF6134 family protein n=1 Tax=Ferrovibrio terrae TaxID=2594003 RepID=UPI003137B107